MSTSDLETLQLQFDSLLCQQTSDNLSKLATHMHISENLAGKRRLEIVKLVRLHLDTVLNEPDGIDLDEYFHDLIAFLKGEPPPLEKTEEEKEVERLRIALRDLKLQQEMQLKSIMDELEAAKKKLSGGATATSGTDNSDEGTATQSAAVTPSILRREFKISGQIGEPGQADKLTYLSLIHQIDSGVAKGYTEDEICDAVIKAISPHSSLRNYVLTMPDRSLGKLRSILRVFSQQKTASDLYQRLVTTSQETKETPQQFLLRALDARNKVLFAAQEENSQGEYTKQLVQNTFLKTMETGLRDENLVTNFRPFLRPPGLSDEALMKNLNELANKQAERKAKVISSSDRQRAAKVFMTGTPENDIVSDLSSAKERRAGSNTNENMKLYAEVKELKTHLADLKRSVEENQQASYRPPRFQARDQGKGRGRHNFRGPSYRPLGCQTCRKNGRDEFCDHCFKCGQSGHFRSQCNSPVQSREGNAQRLFQGGRE